MKILEEEREENECPKCKIPLEFQGNEMKDNGFIMRLKFFLSFFTYDPTTGNGWFWCDKCKTSYLIEDYVSTSKEEKNG